MAGTMRIRTTTVVALAAAAVLAACGGTGGSPRAQQAADTDDGPVRLLLFGDPHELKAYGDLVDAYRSRSGGKQVQLVEASDREDLIARLSTSIAGGSPPDVFLLNYRYYAQFAAKEAIAPAGPRLASSGAIKEADFYPQALDAFRWRGQLMCMPQNVSSLAVYYNRTLFRKYGVAEPPAGWTFTDLVSTAAALTRDRQGNPVKAAEAEGTPTVATYGLGVEPTLIRLAPFLWSNGGALVDDPANPSRLSLDSPQATAVLREFFGLRQSYGVVPTDEEVEAEDDASRFANGRLAMLLSSRRETTTFRAIKGFEWDVAPLPRFGAEQAGVLHSDAYCITSRSPRQNAAWQFVEFAMTAEGQRILARTGRTVPSNIAVSRSDAFLDPGKPPKRAQVFLDAIEHVRPVPTLSTWPEIEDAVEPILEDAFYKGLSVDQVATRIDAATKPIFARAEGP
jgi:multiple sugar transport system substrate-binding protein